MISETVERKVILLPVGIFFFVEKSYGSAWLFQMTAYKMHPLSCMRGLKKFKRSFRRAIPCFHVEEALIKMVLPPPTSLLHHLAKASGQKSGNILGRKCLAISLLAKLYQ